MNEVELAGCVPDRLLGFLAALGVLRVVGRQADPAARGAWRGNAFVLTSGLDRAALEEFLLHEYQPSPLVMPWNSGAFFVGKGDSAAGEALAAIERSSSARLSAFRGAVAQTRRIVASFGGLTVKGTGANRHIARASGEDVDDKGLKAEVIRLCRNELPDEVVEWVDAAIVLTSDDELRYPPLLGTGGSDGRMDFTSNYYQRLAEVLPADVPAARKGRRGMEAALGQSAEWLRGALFGEAGGALQAASVGQFDPGSAGGPNAGAGFEADSLVNPWQFILMLEGSLLLAAAAGRRLRAGGGMASIPFTVQPIAVGYATATQAEAGGKSRAELWLPLWSRRWTLAETEQVFNEGRLSVGRRQAANSIDVARAIAQLGVDRGIDAFLRYAFLQRSGNAYFAVYLGRIRTPEVPNTRAGLLGEVDGWHGELRRAAGGAGASFQVALRDLEEAMFRFAQFPEDDPLIALLQAMGRMEQAASRAVAAVRRRDQAAPVPRPLQGLSRRWLPEQGEDASVRIAAALAGIGAERKDGREAIGALRAHLEPVERKGRGWAWGPPDDPAVVWGGGGLVRDLCAILERRLTEALQRDHSPAPLSAPAGLSEGDVAAFLDGRVDDRRIADLLWAFSALSARMRGDVAFGGDEPLPNAYTLLKLTLLPQEPIPPSPAHRPGQSWRRQDDRVFEPRVVWLLRAGRLREALDLAGRRPRIAGLPPLATDFLFDGDLARLEAALLLPVSAAAIARLERRVLKAEQDEHAEEEEGEEGRRMPA